jgi:hypothetical protein
MNECPKCKSQKVVPGRLSLKLHSTRSDVAFVPGTIKWYQFSLEGGAELKQEAFACGDCGLVWTSVAYPENLRLLIKQFPKNQ